MEVHYLKMVALIFNAFVIVESYNFHEYYNSKACIPKNDILSCICKNREDISMLMSADMNIDIRVIELSGCGVVNVPFGAVAQLELEKIIFSDILTLIINPYAFAGAVTVYNLQIEDIANFSVATAGFIGLFSVSDFIIRNISSMYVQESGFGGISNIERFIIKNTNFTEIKGDAFILTNITNFSVVDSNVNVMQSNAFLIHNAENVLFENCNIPETTNHSFSMAFVDSVVFSNCNFEFLDTNSVHLKYPGRLQFKNCTVRKLSKYAFSLVDLVKTVTFTHNTIISGYASPLHLENDNLTISTSNKSLSVFTYGNSFRCNCDIYWMWISEEPFYNINTSFCIGSKTFVSDITPELDIYGNCTALEPKIPEDNSNLEVIGHPYRNADSGHETMERTTVHSLAVKDDNRYETTERTNVHSLTVTDDNRYETTERKTVPSLAVTDDNRYEATERKTVPSLAVTDDNRYEAKERTTVHSLAVTDDNIYETTEHTTNVRMLAVSAGALLKIPLTCFIILNSLASFIYFS